MSSCVLLSKRHLMEPVVLPRHVASHRRRDRPGRRALTMAALWLTGGLALATVLGLVARLWWVFELFCHFSVQYFWGFVITAGLLAGMKNYKLAIYPAVFGLLHLGFIAPLYVGGKVHASSVQTVKLRVMSLNVQSSNREHRMLCEYVRRATPDVVLFFEVNDAWDEHLVQLRDEYPYSKTSPEKGTFGLAIYSRVPLWDVKFESLDDGNHAVIAQIGVDSTPLTLIGAHPYPPLSGGMAASRQRQFVRLGELLAAKSGPIVLAGDLNVTSWSPLFTDLVAKTGLRDSRRGFGVMSSWPAEYCPLGITIDHCLVSPDIEV